jgi:hypothetical protein
MHVAKVGYGPDSFSVRAKEGFEFSGVTSTTVENNISSFCIGYQLLYVPYGSREHTITRIREMLLNCGWMVTIELCDVFEDIQFLKNSPHYTVSGEIETCLNLGVILRALGQKIGGLVGKQEQSLLARQFNCGLVAGFVHAGTHELTECLRQKFPPANCVHHNSNATLFLSGDDVGYVDTASLCRRYRITLSDFHYLIHLIMMSDVGYVINCVASRAILGKDYGL